MCIYIYTRQNQTWTDMHRQLNGILCESAYHSYPPIRHPTPSLLAGAWKGGHRKYRKMMENPCVSIVSLFFHQPTNGKRTSMVCLRYIISFQDISMHTHMICQRTKVKTLWRKWIHTALTVNCLGPRITHWWYRGENSGTRGLFSEFPSACWFLTLATASTCGRPLGRYRRDFHHCK